MVKVNKPTAELILPSVGLLSGDSEGSRSIRKADPLIFNLRERKRAPNTDPDKLFHHSHNHMK